MRSPEYFRGKRVAITGGSSGIGLALAQRLAAVGAELVLVAQREAGLAAARDELLRSTPGAVVETRPCDVADADAVSRTLGDDERLDVLICSAGISTPGRFLEATAADLRRHMDVNYFGTVNACRAVLPRFVARRAGHVVLLGSLAGHVGIYGYSAYTPTKFALTGLAQVLRAELRPHGVRVSIVHPPDTATPMLEREVRLRPPELQAALAGTKVLPVDVVADAILSGVAAGRFDVWCDAGSRLVAVLQAVAPWFVRRQLDTAQDRGLPARTE